MGSLPRVSAYRPAPVAIIVMTPMGSKDIDLIQKAIDILKVRWPEVMLVVVLQAAMSMLGQEIMMFMENVDPQKTMLPLWSSFLLFIGTFGVSIVWLMLYLGFLKTASMEEVKIYEPGQLLQYGKSYFWRYLSFYILISCTMFILGGLVIGLFTSVISRGEENYAISEWFMQSCALGVLLGMIKPMLFIPARILVHGNTALEALYSISFYRMGQFRRLNRSIGVGFTVLLVAALFTLFQKGTILYYIFSSIYYLLFSSVMLFLTLLVVLSIQNEYNAKQSNDIEKESIS
ncbi:MAG: hypothetical protein ACYSTR_02895 [Planctomycetota bacterium]